MCLDLYVHWVSRSIHLTELKQSDWVISASIINEFQNTISTSKPENVFFFFQSVNWKRHCVTHWLEQNGMDSYRERKISLSDCKISSNCGKNSNLHKIATKDIQTCQYPALDTKRPGEEIDHSNWTFNPSFLKIVMSCNVSNSRQCFIRMSRHQE